MKRIDNLINAFKTKAGILYADQPSTSTGTGNPAREYLASFIEKCNTYLTATTDANKARLLGELKALSLANIGSTKVAANTDVWYFAVVFTKEAHLQSDSGNAFLFNQDNDYIKPLRPTSLSDKIDADGMCVGFTVLYAFAESQEPGLGLDLIAGIKEQTHELAFIYEEDDVPDPDDLVHFNKLARFIKFYQELENQGLPSPAEVLVIKSRNEPFLTAAATLDLLQPGEIYLIGIGGFTDATKSRSVGPPHMVSIIRSGDGMSYSYFDSDFGTFTYLDKAATVSLLNASMAGQTFDIVENVTHNYPDAVMGIYEIAKMTASSIADVAGKAGRLFQMDIQTLAPAYRQQLIAGRDDADFLNSNFENKVPHELVQEVLLDMDVIKNLSTHSYPDSRIAAQYAFNMLYDKFLLHDVQLGIVDIWTENKAPVRHYVATIKKLGATVVVDLAPQTSDASAAVVPIIKTLGDWQVETELAMGEEMVASFSQAADIAALNQDFPFHSAPPDFARFPVEHMIYNANLPFWAEEGIYFPELYAQRILLKALDPANAANTAQIDQLKASIAAFEARFIELSLIMRNERYNVDLPTSQQLRLDTTVPSIAEPLLTSLDTYHATRDFLSFRGKMAFLSDLAASAANLMPSVFGERAKLLSESAQLNMISLVADAQALGTATTWTELWQTPSAFELAAPEIDNVLNPDAGFNYEKQLIVQLQGDRVTFEAGRLLYAKHPEKSEWIQWRGLFLGDAFGKQGNPAQTVHLSNVPYEKNGPLRIVLVGHTTTEAGETRFVEHTLEEVQRGIKNMLVDLLQQRSNRLTGLRLDLVGCKLAAGQLQEQTLPGKLAVWLMDVADDLNIPRVNCSVSARQYEVRIAPDGKKEVNVPLLGWVNKETAIANDILYKYDIGWDPVNERLTNRKPSSGELAVLDRQLRTVKLQPNLDTYFAASVNNSINTIGAELGAGDAAVNTPPAHRTTSEQLALQNLKLIAQADKWNLAVEGIRQIHNLSSDWIPVILDNANPPTGSIRFVNRVNGQSKDISTTDTNIAAFAQDIKELFGSFKKGFTQNPDTGIYHPVANASEVDGVNSLNAAFMIMSLMNYKEQLDAPGQTQRFNDAMKVQFYSSLLQNSLSLFDDAAKLAAVLNEVLTGGSLASKISLASIAGGVAGVVLGAVNITAAAICLSQTTDPQLKTALASQIGIAGFQLLVSGAGILAGIIGASLLASVLSIAAVPLAGIATGIPALVQGYASLRDGFDDAGNRFNQLLDTVTPAGFEINDGLATVRSGAAVDSINFDTATSQGTLQYSTLTVTATNGGSGHSVTDGWDHYFARPDADWNTELDIYEGFGVNKTQSFNKSQVKTLVLPTGFKRKYKTAFQQVTDRRSANVPAFRKLREHYGERFVWGCYAPPTDWAIYKLTETQEPVTVSISLDAENRTLIVPPLVAASADAQSALDKINALLAYQIKGKGGMYTLMLAPQPMNITINPVVQNTGTWIINVDAAIKQYSFATVNGAETLSFGSYKKLDKGYRRSDIFKYIQLQGNDLMIDGRRFVHFGSLPQSLIVQATVDAEKGTFLCFSIDTTGAGIANEPFFLQSQTGTFNSTAVQQGIMTAGRNFLTDKITNIATMPYFPVYIGQYKGLYLPGTDTLVAATDSDLVAIKKSGTTFSQSSRQVPQNFEMIFAATGKIMCSGNVTISGAATGFVGIFNTGTLNLSLQELQLPLSLTTALLSKQKGGGPISDFAGFWEWLPVADRNALTQVFSIGVELVVSCKVSESEYFRFGFDNNGKLQIKTAVWKDENDTGYAAGETSVAISVAGQYTAELLNDPLLSSCQGKGSVIIAQGPADRLTIPNSARFQRIFIYQGEAGGNKTVALEAPKADVFWDVDGSDLLITNKKNGQVICLADTAALTGEAMRIVFGTGSAPADSLTVPQLKSNLPRANANPRLASRKPVGANYFYDPELKQVFDYTNAEHPSQVSFSAEPISDAFIDSGFLNLVGDSGTVYRLQNGKIRITGRRQADGAFVPYNEVFELDVTTVLPEAISAYVIIDGAVYLRGASGLLYTSDSSQFPPVNIKGKISTTGTLMPLLDSNGQAQWLGLGNQDSVAVAADGTAYLIQINSNPALSGPSKLTVFRDINATQAAFILIAIEGGAKRFETDPGGRLFLIPSASAYSAKYVLKEGKAYLSEAAFSASDASQAKHIMYDSMINAGKGNILISADGVKITLPGGTIKTYREDASGTPLWT